MVQSKNELSLNFNKANYVHFTNNSNMAVKLKIGFNNNSITNGSYAKFLGVTMNNTLSWNNYFDLLMKKLSTACYIIDRLCGLVVRVSGYRYRGLGFDSRRYQIF